MLDTKEQLLMTSSLYHILAGHSGLVSATPLMIFSGISPDVFVSFPYLACQGFNGTILP
jgi:hypothetical protein